MGSADDDTVPAGGSPPGGTDDIGPGSRVGHYRITDRVAAGGFGTVFRAEHLVLGRVVAVKVLHPILAGSREHVARFEREARAVNTIGHPHIVDVHEFGELPDGRPFFVMEFLDGESLDRRIARGGPLSPVQTLAILEPICDALAAAHERGIVHRDVKASNVVMAGDRVVLVDFGVAKLVDDPSAQLTKTGQRIGTPSSMAPEQIAGGALDARTDVFALGAMTYHMLAGTRAFGNESATVMKFLHVHSAPPRVSDRVPVAIEIDDAVSAAMAADPSERPAGAREYWERLRAAIEPKAAVAISTRAVGVYVDVTADQAALAAPDESLLDDMDAIVPLAVEQLAAAGFRVAVDSGTAALLVLPLRAEDAGARARALACVSEAWRHIDERATKHPRVVVALVVHVDDAVLSGSKVRGSVTRFATWVPGTLDGVMASDAVLDGLDETPDGVRAFTVPRESR